MQPKDFVIPADLAHAIAEFLTQRPHRYAEVAPLIEGLKRLQPLPVAAQPPTPDPRYPNEGVAR